MVRIGVLDIQGSVIEHIHILNQISNVNPVRVKYPSDLEKIDGLILPGGESTTIGKLLKAYGFMNPLKDLINQGLPIWGTCAGLILLAKDIYKDTTSYLATMDITAKRNAYGNQLASFIVEEHLDFCHTTMPLVFIRAPYIEKHGSNVDVLKTYNGKIIAAKQDNMFVTSFHPELTTHTQVHEYFINKIVQSNNV